MATSAPTTELVLRFTCPACGHRLTVPVRKSGSRGPCPKCTQPVTAPPIDGTVAGYDDIVEPVLAAIPVAIAPPKPSFDELSAPEPPPIADPIVGRTSRWNFSPPWRARWTWRLIYWGTLVGLAGLFEATKFGPIGFLGALWLFPVGRYATSWWLMPLVYRTFTCPGCHEVHDAVSFWACSCGYKPHRPKHLFSKCPSCGEGAGRTECTRCGATMLIW